jgi:CBS domain containing-hemolysin-like protein
MVCNINRANGGNMEVQIRDTIITDEYLVMGKTNDILKIAEKVAESPSGLVIIKEKKGHVLGVITFKEIINNLLKKKNLKKVKFTDIIQKNIMKVKDTDNIEKVMKRIRRRKPIATIVVNDKDQLVGYFSESDLSYAKACQKIIDNILK